MASLWSYHEAGQLHEPLALLARFGHAAEVVEFALNPDSYYFPNVRGDQLVRPNGVSEDQIPVVALENGQEYQYRRPSLHYLQRLALSRAGLSFNAIHCVEVSLSHSTASVTTSGGSKGTGSVRVSLVPLDPHRKTSVESKPILIFNTDQRDRSPDDDLTSVALHELVHVVQTLSNPIHTRGKGLEKELQAYGVQSKLVSNLEIPYTLSTAAAGEVDMFRRKYLGRDNYKPTREFAALFRKHDIFNRIAKDLD